MFVLPKTTVEGYTVLHIVANDSSKFEFAPNCIRFSMMVELILKHFPKQKGLVIFCDMRDQKKQFWKVNPMLVINLVKWVQKANPVKLKRVILYNVDYFTDLLVNKMLRPFISQKIYDRVTFTKDNGFVLKDHIEIEKLPSDFSGEEVSSDQLNDKWMSIIEDHRDWFQKTSKWIKTKHKE